MSMLSATPLTIIKSKEAGSKKVPPVPVLAILPLKEGAKPVNGTMFLTLKHTAHSAGGRTMNGMILGSREPVAIPIRRDASVFGADDKAKSADAKKANVTIRLADLPKDAVTATQLLCDEFVGAVKRPDIAKLWVNSLMMGPVLSTPIKTHFSHRCPEAAMRGKPRDEPILDLAVWFVAFSKGFGQLAGKPRTAVFDWATRALDVAGKETFQQRTDDKGKTLNAENCGQILRGGDIIRRIEIMFDGGSVYNEGFSQRWSVYQIWTERCAGSDNYLEDESESVAPAAALAPVAAPVAALVAQMAALTIAAAADVPIAHGEELIEGDVFPEDEEQR